MNTTRQRGPLLRSLTLESLEGRRVLAPMIDVGHHQLLPDTPGQRIEIQVRSEEADLEVTDFLLRAQIGNGLEDRPTPLFQCTDSTCIVPPRPTTALPWFVGGGQIWDAVSTTVVGGPLFANPPAVPADYQNVAQATVTIDTVGATTKASGLLVRLEVDTTGIAGGNSFDLRLADTIIGVDSHFLTTGPVRVDPVIVNGTIEVVENTTLRVLSVETNRGQVDPDNLPGTGGQPTSWQQQRSDLRSITVHFNEPVDARPSDLVLTNLGVDAPADEDVVVALTAEQLSVDGRRLTIEFPPDSEQDLLDGVYRLEVLPTISNGEGLELDGDGDGTTGDGYSVEGARDNGLFQLTADLNGDAGVSIFDFSVIAYWFGQPVPGAPDYVNFNFDDGISIFDFSIFAARFQDRIVFPTALLDTALPAPSGGATTPMRTVARNVATDDDSIGEVVDRALVERALVERALVERVSWLNSSVARVRWDDARPRDDDDSTDERPDFGGRNEPTVDASLEELLDAIVGRDPVGL